MREIVKVEFNNPRKIPSILFLNKKTGKFRISKQILVTEVEHFSDGDNITYNAKAYYELSKDCNYEFIDVFNDYKDSLIIVIPIYFDSLYNIFGR